MGAWRMAIRYSGNVNQGRVVEGNGDYVVQMVVWQRSFDRDAVFEGNSGGRGRVPNAWDASMNWTDETPGSWQCSGGRGKAPNAPSGPVDRRDRESAMDVVDWRRTGASELIEQAAACEGPRGKPAIELESRSRGAMSES